MARVYPERIPEHILSDPRRTAECAVFEALTQLPDSFNVYYSVAWLSRRLTGDAQDGEADFVVAHPELGVLILEVKGGSIAYDAATGQWSSANRHGEVFPIKDPAAQARTNKHALLQKLRDMPGWSIEWLTIGHAVVFPDTIVADAQLRPDLPKEIILDGSSLTTIEYAIQRVFAYFHQTDGRTGRLGTSRLQVLDELLAKSFNLRTPLGIELSHQDERLIELTEQQMQILDMLSFQRRATVCGCAGSGKTMLAIEKARRLAAEGFDVLLTCFNVQLAEHLANRAPDGVSVFHFHGLCEYLIREADIKAIPPRDANVYYNQFLPDLMLEAVESLGPQFDAIIVDEGQDFRENWWLALNELLREPKIGVLYVFFDDNQNLYQGVTQLANLIDSQPFLLVENCRNTQQIHHLVARFHQQGSRLKARGPFGTAPQWLPYTTTEEMLRVLRRTLHNLVNEEAVSPKDLIVLTPRAEARSALTEGLTLGNFALTRKPPRLSGQIQVDTIHRFKGLERKVVIIAELDEAAHRDKSLILYVGCSRARVHLILLHKQGFSP